METDKDIFAIPMTDLASGEVREQWVRAESEREARKALIGRVIGKGRRLSAAEAIADAEKHPVIEV